MATHHLSQQIAQSIGVPSYELDLSTITPEQIVYNGKCTYISLETTVPHGGWCHLLLLRGPSRWLAVITQTPDCKTSVVNNIEHIASFVLYFFNTPLMLYVHSPQDEEGEEVWEELTFVPEHITFVQYLPAGCFGMESNYPNHEYDVMKFSWEEREVAGRRYLQAGKPTNAPYVMGMWRDARREDINILIRNL